MNLPILLILTMILVSQTSCNSNIHKQKTNGKETIQRKIITGATLSKKDYKGLTKSQRPASSFDKSSQPAVPDYALSESWAALWPRPGQPHEIEFSYLALQNLHPIFIIQCSS